MNSIKIPLDENPVNIRFGKANGHENWEKVRDAEARPDCLWKDEGEGGRSTRWDAQSGFVGSPSQRWRLV